MEVPQDPSPMSIVINTLTRLESKTDAGFARLDAKLETKADKADIIKLDGRLDSHQKRIEHAEDRIREHEVEAKTQESIDSQHKDKRQTRFNILIGSMTTAAIICGVVLPIVH